MNLLLDTHILIWWATDDPVLPRACRDLLLDTENSVSFSSISIWEVSIKNEKGLLSLPPDLLWEKSLEAGLLEVSFTSAHAAKVRELPPLHRDPFDRALIAQALCGPYTLVSQDRLLAQYPVLLKQF